MADVLKSFIKELPKEDLFHEVAQENPLVTKLISEGYTGRKGKGGFYRINKEGGKKFLEAINLQTGEYAPSKKINQDTDDKINFEDLISRDDKYGKYAWIVISKIINYAASLIPDVTKEYNNIDEAMRLGFNWVMGPFEILELIGIERFLKKNKNFNLNKFIKDLSSHKVLTKLEYNILQKGRGYFYKWYLKKQLYLDSTIRTLRRITSGSIPENPDTQAFDNSSVRIIPYLNSTDHLLSYKLIEFKTKANTLDSKVMIPLGTPLFINPFSSIF